MVKQIFPLFVNIPKIAWFATNAMFNVTKSHMLQRVAEYRRVSDLQAELQLTIASCTLYSVLQAGLQESCL